GGSLGAIQIRDVKTGQTAVRVSGHPSRVFGLDFKPDGTRLASASADGIVKLWDTQTGVEVLSLRGHATFDTIVGFSADGDRCVAGGADGFMRMWSVKSSAPGSPDSSRERRREWHQSQAKRFLEERQWFRTAFHFGQLVQLEPDHREHRQALAQALAEQGKWDEAARELDALLLQTNCPTIQY